MARVTSSIFEAHYSILLVAVTTWCCLYYIQWCTILSMLDILFCIGLCPLNVCFPLTLPVPAFLQLASCTGVVWWPVSGLIVRCVCTKCILSPCHYKPMLPHRVFPCSLTPSRDTWPHRQVSCSFYPLNMLPVGVNGCSDCTESYFTTVRSLTKAAFEGHRLAMLSRPLHQLIL